MPSSDNAVATAAMYSVRDFSWRVTLALRKFFFLSYCCASILNLTTRCWLVVDVTSRPLYPGGKNPITPCSYPDLYKDFSLKIQHTFSLSKSTKCSVYQNCYHL